MADDAPKPPPPLPRLRLDLAKLARGGAFLPGWRTPGEADVRDALARRGWVEADDGWWVAPSELEWQLTVYAASARGRTPG